MPSTLKLRESDPHDDFTIAPEIVPAAWADKVLADITRDTSQDISDQPSQAGSSAPAPTVDMNFRATPANDIHTPNVQIPNVHIPSERPAGPPPTGNWARSTIIAFMFALCSAFAAAGWQHYGAAAKQMISAWTPPFTLTSSAPEPTGLAAQPDTSAVQVPTQASAQAATTDQAPPQPAQAQATDSTAPAVTAPAADAAQFQSMARDLAAMGQEIELLKATVAELKSAQQPVARDTAKIAAIKPSETKPAAPNPRPRISVPPPRVAAVPPRKPIQAAPVQAYPVQAYRTQGYPAQAYPSAAPPPSPQQLPPPASLQSAPPPPTAVPSDDGPVIRPPMPLQ